MRDMLVDAAYGLVIAALIMLIIMFSSGTTKFLYIDF
jgi:hypothetical protein